MVAFATVRSEFKLLYSGQLSFKAPFPNLHFCVKPLHGSPYVKQVDLYFFKDILAQILTLDDVGTTWADLSWCDMWQCRHGWICPKYSLGCFLLSPGICIILVHLLIKFKLNILPESVAVVSLGEYVLHKHHSVQAESRSLKCFCT